jgi:hypothetical protein
MNLVHVGAWPADAGIKPFEKFRDEFSVFEGILLRGNRIVVRISLKKRILKLGHESHVGIVLHCTFLR